MRSALLSFSESIRKVLDKQPIKFVRAVKQDLRSGKTEDRILVRRRAPPLVVVVVVVVVVVMCLLLKPKRLRLPAERRWRRLWWTWKEANCGNLKEP